MHVDRPRTHVVSAIVHVANDLAPGQRWPLRIFSHDGTLHKIDFAPGDVVLYESARLVHGRPLALPGNEYANLFLHFRPRGWEKTRPELGACTRTADHQNVMGGWREEREREGGDGRQKRFCGASGVQPVLTAVGDPARTGSCRRAPTS